MDYFFNFADKYSLYLTKEYLSSNEMYWLEVLLKIIPRHLTDESKVSIQSNMNFTYY